MNRKNAFVLSGLIFLLLLSMVLSVDKVRVSAVPLSPCIAVLPEKTVDTTIEPGMNYTISVYTNYTGNDIWSWEFSLTFNPIIFQMGFYGEDAWIGDNLTVSFTASKAPVAPFSEKIYVDNTLMTNANYTIAYGTGEITFTVAPSLGAEVKAEYTWTGLTNGDLISTAKDPSAKILPGTIDNAIGKLSLTSAFFFYPAPPPPTTSGPGILANVTFSVIGYGFSDITLGEDTRLVGPAQPPYYLFDYDIISASLPPGSTSKPYGSDHIGNGRFENIDDVAIVGLTTPAKAILGDYVAINVTVANAGNVTRTFNITVYANTILVGNQTVSNLAEREITTITFNWNTTDIPVGNYVINATAWLPPEDEPKDNTKTATTDVKTLHDVAIGSLEIQDEANQGDVVTVKVTVVNQGTFEENVNLTIYYQRRVQYPERPKGFNTTIFTLGKRPTSRTIQTNWNTTGLDRGSYTINATLTIDIDEDLSDNTLAKMIALTLGHDVSITEVSATPKVFVGETVAISVTVQNAGGLNETLVDVRVTSGMVIIGSQQIPSLNIGNSVTLSFTWSTVGLNPQTYGVDAEAILNTDVDQTNNKKAVTVVVAVPAGMIAGRIKDASTGNPIEGVVVTCSTYANTTRADGSYRLANVLAGNYTVTASKNGYQTSSQTSIRVVAGQTTNLNFTLTALTTGRITGKVTDASTGNPIEGAQVTVGGSSVSTNATGDYIIEVPVGNYTLTASANGYASSSETGVSVAPGATTAVNFKLMPDAPSNILLYAAVAAAAVVIAVAVTVVYLRRRKKAA